MHGMETMVRAAFVKRPAWHRLGEVAEDENISLPEFQVLAKMNYTATAVPALVETENGPVIVPNQFHIQRLGENGDFKVVSPATVTSKFGVITTDHMVELLKPLVEAGYARPDAAFTMRGGQIEVITLKLEPLQNRNIEGDDSRWTSYAILQNFHGRGKFRGIVSHVRAVCANTVAIAFAGGADFAIPHTKNVDTRARDLVAAWESIQEQTARMDKAIEVFAGHKVNVPNTIDDLLGLTEKRKAGEKITAQAATKRDRLIYAATNSPGTEGKTLADIFNGATFLATHDPFGRGGQNENVRMDSVLNGTRRTNVEKVFASLAGIAGLDSADYRLAKERA